MIYFLNSTIDLLLLKRPTYCVNLSLEEALMIQNPCRAWRDLIESKDRGKIYDLFNREREELTDHLKGCDICKNVLIPLLPEDPEQLEFFTPQKFAEIIRETYSKVEKTDFKFEGDGWGDD